MVTCPIFENVVTVGTRYCNKSKLTTNNIFLFQRIHKNSRFHKACKIVLKFDTLPVGISFGTFLVSLSEHLSKC